MKKYDHKKIEKKWLAQLKKVEPGKQDVKKALDHDLSIIYNGNKKNYQFHQIQ